MAAKTHPYYSRPTSTVSLKSRVTLKSKAVDYESDLDPFWVTTDEESDGKGGTTIGRRLRSSNPGRSPTPETNDVAIYPETEAAGHTSGQNGTLQPKNVDRKQGIIVSKGWSGARGTRGRRMQPVPGSEDDVKHVETRGFAPLDFEEEGSSSQGGDEKGITRLRELERQMGLTPGLEEREAGVVAMRVRRKAEMLGLAAGKQREQVEHCILEAELGRAHANTKLCKWDGVGQGLRTLVGEKDAELQKLRALADEHKRAAEACHAAVQSAEACRQVAAARALEVEKLTSERDQLRLALTDAEMDLQVATSFKGGIKEEDSDTSRRSAGRQSSLKLKEQLRLAEEVNRVNQGFIKKLEEQLRVAKEGHVKERQVWVRDAIAQQSTIMENIKDRENHAKAKEKEAKKLAASVDAARKEAISRTEEVKALKGKLEEREKAAVEEMAGLKKRVEEQTEVVSALEEKSRLQAGENADLEKRVKEQTLVIEGLERRVQEQTLVVKGLEKRVRDQTLVSEGQEKRVNEQSRVIEGLEKQVKERSLSNEALKKKTEEQTRVTETLREEGEKARAQSAVGNQLVKSLKAQIAALGNELRTAKAEGLRVKSESALAIDKGKDAEVAEALAALMSRARGLEHEKAGLGKRLEESERVRKQLAEQQESVGAELRDRQTEAAKARAEVQKLSEELREREHLLTETEAKQKDQIVALEKKLQEVQAEKEQSLEHLEGPEGRNERRESLERQQSLREGGVFGVLQKEQLLSRTMSDVLKRDEEIRTLRTEQQLASEEAAAVENDLQTVKEEREKLTLKTEFLRKKVAELQKQAILQLDQAAASARFHDFEMTRTREELAEAHRCVQQLTQACRSLQAQRNHVGADVAPSGGAGASPGKRKRSRLDESEQGEEIREVSVEQDPRVSELEAALGGKSRELQEKEAEVRGLQEILRVLAQQLEEAEEVNGGGESGTDEGANGAELTPVKSPARNLSLSVDGSVLTAMKKALQGGAIARDSWEVSRAVVPRREPLESSVGRPVGTPWGKERLALKREIEELYDRLEQKEEEADGMLREGLEIWKARHGELEKELEGKTMKLSVMEEVFQDLVGRLEEARAAAARAKDAEKKLGEAEHGRQMLKRRLQKLEESNKTGDRLWKELARLAAINASLEEQIAQLTGVPLSPTQSEPGPKSSPQTPVDGLPSPGNGPNQRKESPTGSVSGRDGIRLSNDIAANLNKAFGFKDSPSGSESEGRLGVPGTVETKVHAKGVVETEEPGRGEKLGTSLRAGVSEVAQTKRLTVPMSPWRSEPDAVESELASPSEHFAGARENQPTESVAPLRESNSASPATSPDSEPRSAAELSNSVFDKLAVLTQPNEQKQSAGGPEQTPSRETPLVASGADVSRKVQVASPGGVSENGAGNPEERESKGALRNWVRWFETKVPTKKSGASKENPPGPGISPSYASPSENVFLWQQNSPGESKLGTENMQAGASTSAQTSHKAFAQELPRLKVPEAATEGKGSPTLSSSDVRARLEIIQQRRALNQEDPSPAEQSEEGPVVRRRKAPRNLFYGSQLGALSESNSGSETGSPEVGQRVGKLRHDGRVSKGFGSPQENAVPAFLSWVPPPEVVGVAVDTPPVGKESDGGAPGADQQQSQKGAGMEKEAQATVAGSTSWVGEDSPSSVLERLAALQARGPDPISESEGLVLAGLDIE